MKTGRPISVTEKSYLENESGCWIWTGGVSSSGYGSKHFNGKAHPAHRFVYERLVGPIAAGKQLNHSCDVKLCVNPSHMCIGTQKENVADMFRRGRNRAKTKITELQARRIKFGVESATDISKEIGMSVTCINYIRSGKTWKHLTFWGRT